MPATFQQTFRFNYTKREDGTCSDLNAYRALLETTLELVKRHIPEICTVQNSADRITGQLMISDISEQDQHVSVLNCWLRPHIDLLRYICLPVHDCHTNCCRSLGANCLVIVSYTMEQSHCRSPFVLGAYCVGFMYGVCRSVTPLIVVRKNRLLPWSVPAQCWLHVDQSHPLVSRLSHRSMSSWSVADDVTPVSVAGQCQMMSHRSVSLVSAR